MFLKGMKVSILLAFIHPLILWMNEGLLTDPSLQGFCDLIAHKCIFFKSLCVSNNFLC